MDPSNAPRQVVVIKIGTSSMCNEATQQLKVGALARLVETVVALKQLGLGVVLVSSGAIGLGALAIQATDQIVPARTSAAHGDWAKLQAFAAIGQARMMALWDSLFSIMGLVVAQVLLSRGDVGDRARWRNGCTTLRMLVRDPRIVPIVNENDAVSVAEIKFGDNDTLSAIVAAMVGARELVLLTDVDGLYTVDPKSPGARPIRLVEDLRALQVNVSGPGSSFGTGGMATKLVAAELATAAGARVHILISTQPESIVRVLQASNEELQEGTRFLPSKTAPLPPPLTPNAPLPSRKWWVTHAIAPAGSLVVDMGCAKALVTHRASVFAVGVIRVWGQFQPSQAVLLRAPLNESIQDAIKQGHDVQESDTVIVGKGLVNYSSAECNLVMGQPTFKLHTILQYVESEALIDRGYLSLVDVPEDTN
jgi:glutamate 5-kinase